MDHSNLKQTFDVLVELPFPNGGENEALNDWISDLADVDSFYAGVASTLMTGETKTDKDLPLLDDLFNKLEELHQAKVISQSQYRVCHFYLDALQNLRKEIEIFSIDGKV